MSGVPFSHTDIEWHVTTHRQTTPHTYLHVSNVSMRSMISVKLYIYFDFRNDIIHPNGIEILRQCKSDLTVYTRVQMNRLTVFKIKTVIQWPMYQPMFKTSLPLLLSYRLKFSTNVFEVRIFHFTSFCCSFFLSVVSTKAIFSSLDCQPITTLVD